MPLKPGDAVFVRSRDKAKTIFDQRPGIRGPFKIRDLFPNGQNGQVAILVLSEDHDDVAAVDTDHLSSEEPS